MRYVNPVTDYDLWVALRGQGIGGSDAGTLMRWNKYGSVTRLWREKTGLSTPEFVGNRFTEWGSESEPMILDRYARHRGVPVLGRTVRGNPVVFWPEEDREPQRLYPMDPLVRWLNPLSSPRRPYARANVDGYTLDSAGREITRYLEVKTTREGNREAWDWDPPPTYYAQCLHNKMVLAELGLDVPGEITVLVGGNDWGILSITERPWVMEEMKEREARFWHCVESKEAPKVQKWFPRMNPPSDEEDESMAAPVFAKKSGGLGPEIPPPSAGAKQGVLVDVVDRGEREQEWQGKKKMVSKISLHWLLPTSIIPNQVDGIDLPPAVAGKPHMVTKWFTNSLADAATLRKFLKSWRGHDLTADEQVRYEKGQLDIFSMVDGLNAILTISQRDRDGKVYANVESAAPLMEGMKTYPVPSDWVRFADRDSAEPAVVEATKDQGDDLPW